MLISATTSKHISTNNGFTTRVFQQPLVHFLKSITVMTKRAGASPDNVHVRHLHCEGDKVTLHSGRYVEGPSCRVHAGTVLGVGDLLEHDLDLIKPPTVIHALPNQLNCRLCVILVNKRHVHVIHKVDQTLGPRRSKAHSCITEQHTLHMLTILLCTACI